MLARIKEWLAEPALQDLDVDGTGFSVAHRRVLLRKQMVRELFRSFYDECRAMDRLHFRDCPGKCLEIGSGSSLIKEFYPEVITSDLKPLPFVDRVFAATRMPFRDGELRAIYAINVFHHLPDPRAFLAEALRVLHPGGGIVLIEPFHGPAARWLFKNLHASESFEPEAPGWSNPHQEGAFANANQALSYIVFHRDLAEFEREFPRLELLVDRPHTHLRYLLSGGLNFRQLLPDPLAGLADLAERILAPFNRWIALQHTIVLRKAR